jgi:tetratricopeptide (TPR) repeat protein
MRQRLEKYPSDFSANYNIGDLLLTKGDAAGAIPYFQLAVQASPESVVAATELGIALLSASRAGEAEDQFKHALNSDPHYTNARFGLASIEAASGKFADAVSDFKQVLAERPDDAKASQHCGEVLILWGDQLANTDDNPLNLEQAIARYREALAFRPADADLHTTLGIALARSRKYGEAQVQFQVALSIDPAFRPAKQALEKLALVTHK